jgi:hypothetical protein
MLSYDTSRPALPTSERRTQAIEAMYATAHWLASQRRWHDASDVFRAMAFFAPSDERGWLGLGLCHESLGHGFLALQMYGVGFAMTRSVRCEIARARALRQAGRDDEAEVALERAAAAADEHDNDDERTLVRIERRAP